jgi:hypothetical protein
MFYLVCPWQLLQRFTVPVFVWWVPWMLEDAHMEARMTIATSFYAHSQSCIKPQLISSCPSPPSFHTYQFPLDRFRSYFTLGTSMKICSEILNLVKIRQKYWSVYITYVWYEAAITAFFQWNGIRLLGLPRRYKYYAHVPQGHIIHTLPVLLHENIQEVRASRCKLLYRMKSETSILNLNPSSN